MQVSRLDDPAARRDAVGHYNGSGGVEPGRAQQFAVCDLRYVVNTICIAGQVSPFVDRFGLCSPMLAKTGTRSRSRPERMCVVMRQCCSDDWLDLDRYTGFAA